ncbi:MAG TPA: calcium-binding protein [Xanthomonadaceae bacterium]
MKPIVLLTTALIVAAAGVPVLAQGGPDGKGGGRMAQLDVNKDGAIDRSEAAKAPKLLEHFDRMDANKDGRISGEERPQRGRHGGKGGDRMAQFDANKDGAIDRSEAAKAPKLLEHFDRMDANKDGRISAEERPQRGRRGGKDGRAKLDTDGDQRVSRQEAAQRPQLTEKFAAIDGDRDGYLSREELQAYRREHGKRPQAPAKP